MVQVKSKETETLDHQVKLTLVFPSQYRTKSLRLTPQITVCIQWSFTEYVLFVSLVFF
jgi:hypothetical protein